ncbi:hypothetical protein [Propionispira raffinosivorans]|uniref:hypothetical protein n=1 Tax=Propionispira raffinosivorans TaxID=86959 RepID=UPI00037FC072|nr:hypothetical protein [Propionispira raffinosivorans]
MAYYFFLGMTMLPVPPAKMSIKIKNKNKTIDLINEGEVNIIKSAGLTEISFDARLPNAKYPFANYDTSFADSLSNKLMGSSFSFKKADYFLDTFKSAKTTQTPMRLVISRMNSQYRMLWDTNMLVTIEDYAVNEDFADGFDLVVPLKLKQYKPYATKECEVTTDADGKQHFKVKETRPATDRETPAIYKIRNEQSMWEVCKGVSGGSLDWRTVLSSNGMSNPIGSMEGTVLHLG